MNIAATLLSGIAGWMITYLLHGTVLIALAIIAIAILRARLSDQSREIIWRTALFGGLFTASAAMLLPGGTALFAVELPSFTLLAAPDQPAMATPATAELSESTGSDPAVFDFQTPDSILEESSIATGSDVIRRPRSLASRGSSPTASGEARLSGSQAEFALRSAADGELESASSPAEPSAVARSLGLTGSLIGLGLVACAAVGLLHGLLALLFGQRRLKGMLRDRRSFSAGAGGMDERLERDIFSMCEELRIRFGLRCAVRVSESSSVRVPMALGVRRPEICLPRGAARALEPDRLRAVLAHEMAHLARRDPLWQALHRLIASTFFFQPFNRVACTVLAEIAEFECDRLAVAHRASPVALARSLTQVASWLMPADGGGGPCRATLPRAALTASMARGVGNIRRRIERMLADQSATSSDGSAAAGASVRARRITIVVAAYVVLCAAALLPRIQAAAAVSDADAKDASARGTFTQSAAAPLSAIAPQPTVATTSALRSSGQEELNAAIAAVLSDLREEIDLLESEVEAVESRLAEVEADAATRAIIFEIRQRLEDLHQLNDSIAREMQQATFPHDSEK